MSTARVDLRSRRNFLRLAGSVAVGLGLLMVSDGLLNSDHLRRGAADLGGTLVEPTRASLITVNVYYSMMAQYTNQSEETFVLESPATIQQLIDTCLVRHPSIAQMVDSMMILLDGVPSKATAPLKDGDTIQFIPLTAGG